MVQTLVLRHKFNLVLILGVTTAIFTPDELSVSAKSACEQKHGGHLHILPVPARFYNPLI